MKARPKYKCSKIAAGLTSRCQDPTFYVASTWENKLHHIAGTEINLIEIHSSLLTFNFVGIKVRKMIYNEEPQLTDFDGERLLNSSIFLV